MKGETAVYIALYIDDLFLVGRVLGETRGVKDGLYSEFKMKDLGETNFLLGIEIRRQDIGDVILVQERYARDVVKRYAVWSGKRYGGVQAVDTTGAGKSSGQLSTASQ